MLQLLDEIRKKTGHDKEVLFERLLALYANDVLKFLISLKDKEIMEQMYFKH